MKEYELSLTQKCRWHKNNVIIIYNYIKSITIRTKKAYSIYYVTSQDLVIVMVGAAKFAAGNFL